MNIITRETLPRLWWLNPWRMARELHQTAIAVVDYCDQIETLTDIQGRLIKKQSAEIYQLRERIVELHDSITAGNAIQPDAVPHE
jgi:hypothetical protein